MSSSKRNNYSSLLLVGLLSGFISYRFGMFAGCSSSWLTSIDATNSYSLTPANADDDLISDDADQDRPAYEGREISAPQSNSRDSFVDGNDRRFVQRPSGPYNCGVVFFYHIPSTGGASINYWFRKYTKPKLQLGENITYYQYWQKSVGTDGEFHQHPEDVEAKFRKGMNRHIRNLGPNEWRIAHSHVTSTYLNESEGDLYEWRSMVEAQGCELINTVMLRDPLNHAMSLHKIIENKNATKDDWATYLESPTGTGKWGTVLDFFLYNIHGNRYRDEYPNGPGGRNPFNVTKEVKVKRALELLHRHFDVVTVGDHATFQQKILDWTGWTPIKMPRGNVHKGVLNFTKSEVETLQNLLKKNGDLEFVDQVKLEYHDYLSYLNNN